MKLKSIVKSKSSSSKSLLKETPDTIYIYKGSEHGDTNNEENYEAYSYRSEHTVCTGLLWGYGYDNYVTLQVMPSPGATVKINQKDKNLEAEIESKIIQYFKDTGILESYAADVYDRGHGFLEKSIWEAVNSIYSKLGINPRFDFERTERFRIFYISNIYYFTCWSDKKSDYSKHLKLYLSILKKLNIPLEEIKFEIDSQDFSKRSFLRKLHLSYKELVEYINYDGEEEPQHKITSEIENKIAELNKKYADLKADSHVKWAGWSTAEKNAYRKMMRSIELDLQALFSAKNSGETLLKNVVLTALDSLEDKFEDKVVPADELYAEIERKLKKYGSSSIQIIRALKDKGIDIKSALKEISERCGKTLSETEIISELCKYLSSNTSFLKENQLIPTNDVSSFKEKLGRVNSVEDFLKSFVGFKLEDLLDRISLIRLYMANKYGDTYGESTDQEITKLIDAAISFINFRLIRPLRKKVDDIDAAEKQSDRYIKYKTIRNDILKKLWAAKREGRQSDADKLQDQYNNLEDEPTSYSKNMADMKSKVELIHKTPLSLEEVLPANSDDAVSKEAYREVEKQFKIVKSKL